MIEICIDARNFGNKGSGFAVRMQHDKYDWIRTITLGSITTNQTELKAIEYVLKSIKPEFLNDLIKIRISGKYTLMMLERVGGKWAKAVTSNTKLVEEVRKQFMSFREVVVQFDDGIEEGSVIALLKKLNERAVRKGEIIFDRKP